MLRAYIRSSEVPRRKHIHIAHDELRTVFKPLSRLAPCWKFTRATAATPATRKQRSGHVAEPRDILRTARERRAPPSLQSRRRAAAAVANGVVSSSAVCFIMQQNGILFTCNYSNISKIFALHLQLSANASFTGTRTRYGKRKFGTKLE